MLSHSATGEVNCAVTEGACMSQVRTVIERSFLLNETAAGSTLLFSFLMTKNGSEKESQ